MEGMGWTKQAGIDLKLTRFPNGPAIVQAFASGKTDVMCFGIGPANIHAAVAPWRAKLSDQQWRDIR